MSNNFSINSLWGSYQTQFLRGRWVWKVDFFRCKEIAVIVWTVVTNTLHVRLTQETYTPLLNLTTNSTTALDLFKSPSEKIHELTICEYERSKSKSERGLESEARQSKRTFPNLGIRYALIDILSLTRIFFSDGDLNKSTTAQQRHKAYNRTTHA